MNLYNVSAAQFAETIGVPRSTISHILSGRNKPSLDLIMKILSTYPKVNAEWLITGKKDDLDPTEEVTEKLSGIQSEIPDSNTGSSTTGTKRIKRVVVFFEDGTYTEVAS